MNDSSATPSSTREAPEQAAGGGCASTEDHSRYWHRHGSSDHRLGASGADLRERARFRRLAGTHAVAASTGGKQKLAGTSKRGERTIRRLLIIGATAVVRCVVRKGAPAGSWLERMLSRKPRILVAVALANKMARMIWALLAKGGIYRASIVAA